MQMMEYPLLLLPRKKKKRDKYLSWDSHAARGHLRERVNDAKEAGSGTVDQSRAGLRPNAGDEGDKMQTGQVR